MTVNNGSLCVPDRMRRLLVDGNGYPVPWCVPIVAGKPCFDLPRDEKVQKAVDEKRCWLCGSRLGTYLGFTGDAALAVTRIALEPPSHRDCLYYTIGRSIPAMRRPGVRLVWMTSNYQLWTQQGGALWRLGRPASTRWFVDDRAATHAEVVDAIAAALPPLFQAAREKSADTVALLERQANAALALLPVDPAPVPRA